MLAWLWLSLIVILLDQVTKYGAEALLEPYTPHAVVASFNLTLMYNKGAAFSFLSEAGGWQRWVFILLAVVVGLVLLRWLKGLNRDQHWTAVALSLIIGGAVGNLIDRILYGQVIDFIQLYYQEWFWPAFNVADSAITVGVAIMLIEMFFEKGEKR